jgi:AmmeMemoRadiSam system protein B
MRSEFSTRPFRVTRGKKVKAFVVPHAGIDYSGHCAGQVYQHISPQTDRVILLGPSHFTDLKGCAISVQDQNLTPIGELKVDQILIKELRKTKKFKTMD